MTTTPVLRGGFPPRAKYSSRFTNRRPCLYQWPPRRVRAPATRGLDILYNKKSQCSFIYSKCLYYERFLKESLWQIRLGKYQRFNRYGRRRGNVSNCVLGLLLVITQLSTTHEVRRDIVESDQALALVSWGSCATAIATTAAATISAIRRTASARFIVLVRNAIGTSHGNATAAGNARASANVATTISSHDGERFDFQKLRGQKLREI